MKDVRTEEKQSRTVSQKPIELSARYSALGGFMRKTR